MHEETIVLPTTAGSPKEGRRLIGCLGGERGGGPILSHFTILPVQCSHHSYNYPATAPGEEHLQEAGVGVYGPPGHRAVRQGGVCTEVAGATRGGLPPVGFLGGQQGDRNTVYTLLSGTPWLLY